MNNLNLGIYQSLTKPDIKITLRKVTLHDQDYLLNLRNDPACRINSTRTYPLSKDYYYNWLSKILENNKCLFFIAESNDLRLGYFLFELKESEYFLSYALNDYARGKKLAFRILQEAINLFFNQFKYAQLYAFVKKHNEPSLKVLNKLNFVRIVEDEEKILFVYNKDYSNLTDRIKI